VAGLAAAAAAVAQAPSSQPSAFDACGYLVAGPGCILFEGGGGTYVLPQAEGFQFGDFVRVVGTLDPECVTICPQADGCIRGARVYSARQFPCGTHLPNFPEDIVINVCSSLSGLFVAGPLIAVFIARRYRNLPGKITGKQRSQ